MQRLIVGLLVLAFVGAGATVWLVNNYIDRRIQVTTKQKVEPVQMSKVVLVAKDDIPIGKKIERGDLEWLAWPDNGIQGNFLAAAQPDGKLAAKIIGAIARRGIIKGTPLTESSVFRRATPGFLAGALAPKMRAVSISVTPESGASGFIMPGDRVDVILMQDVRRNLQAQSGRSEEGFKPYVRYTAETVLQNLRVLAVDQKVDDFEKKAQVSRTVTVEVTPKQAEALTVAKAMGTLGLSLRSFVDNKVAEPSEAEAARKSEGATSREMPAMAAATATADVPSSAAGNDLPGENATATTDLEISPVLASSVATASGPVRPPPPAPAVRAAPPPARKGTPIRIYRGGQPSTVNF